MKKIYFSQKEKNAKALQSMFEEVTDPEKKKQFDKFIKSYVMSGASEHTIATRISNMVFFNRAFPEDLNQLNEESVNNAIFWLENETYVGKNGEVREYSDHTKLTKKMVWKQFLKFIGREDLADMIKIKNAGRGKLPEDLLTRDEVFELISAANTLRDKALISLLYESGARSGEILSLKIKNLERHEAGYRVHFPQGKTGARSILIVYSAKHIFNYLQSHPDKENRNSPLWLQFFGDNIPMSHGALHSMLRGVAKKAGVKKRVNPHSFRHAQATELAKDFTEQQLKRYLGWTSDSKMAAVYVHLSGRDIDDAILAKNGLEVESRRTQLKANECPRCHFMSEAEAKYCAVCGLPLTVEANSTIEAGKTDIATTLMQLAGNDPELMKAFKAVADALKK